MVNLASLLELSTLTAAKPNSGKFLVTIGIMFAIFGLGSLFLYKCCCKNIGEEKPRRIYNQPATEMIKADHQSSINYNDSNYSGYSQDKFQ